MAGATVSLNGQMDALDPQPSWARRLTGLPGITLCFIWGLAEGTFFFVVPDVAISMVAMLKPRRVWRHILAAIAGSVIAGMILFSWSVSAPEAAHRAVARVPFVTAWMFARVHASLQEHRSGAIFLGPMSGIPYKIYAIEASEFVGRKTFLLCTGPARAARFLIIWGGFGIAGNFLRRSRNWTARKLSILQGTFWILFYAFYWGMIVLP